VTRRAVEYAGAVVVIGLLAGVAGAATTVVLQAVEHLVYHYSFGSLLTGVGGSSPVRRAVGPMIGGALAGFGWWILRRRGDVPSLSPTIAEHRPIPRWRWSIDAGLQVLLVGSGASLGREGAPRQFSAALGDLGTSRWSLTARDREILLACAAGAGLAAVYSVPLGGAVFAVRILLGTWHPRAVGTALITSSLAVAVSSPVTHLEHTLVWPDPNLSFLFVLLACAIAPLAVAVGLVFNRLMTRVRPKPQIRSWVLVPAIAVAGLATGVCSIWWPELPGNGRSILAVSVDSGLTLGGAAVILLLKPLLTAVYLRTGAVGGLMTPALATGAAAGTVVTIAINHLAGIHLQVAAVSLACAAGVLAITQRGPLFAALFVWELARPPLWLFLVFAAAAFTAHGIQLLRERNLARRSSVAPRAAEERWASEAP
jgi:H+/Cl- antiporter ClcA